MPYHNHLLGEGFPAYAIAFFLWGTVTLALAFVTFSFIELPFLKLRDRVLAKNQVAKRSPSVALTATSPSVS